MAKNVIICVLFVGLVGVSLFSLFKASEVSDRNRRLVLAEQEREQARAALEQAKTRLKQVRDSLEVAYIVASNARIDARKAHYETERIKKQYEQIIFTSYPSDSARLRVLSKLYPSINHP